MNSEPKNQFPITPEALRTIGYDYDEDALEEIADVANTELENRVGTELASLLTDKQLETLVQLQEDGDDAAADAHLTASIPDRQQVIQDEVNILMGELAKDVEKDLNK